MEAKDFFLSTLQSGDIIEAVVQNPADFGVFCDIGCGFTALMRIDRCCISRLETTASHYFTGQNIYAAVHSIDHAASRIHLTGRELLGTWEENAAQFQVGQTVTGIVRSIKDYGAFVELTPNLSGLAEPNFDLHPGDHISVYIKSILPERLKIKLVALRKLEPSSVPEKPLHYFRTAGHISQWQYGTSGYSKTCSVF